MMEFCPFCKRDPYEWVDIGVGYQPVAVTCCELGEGIAYGEKHAKQVLKWMRSPSPKKKAKARKAMVEAGSCNA